MDYDYYIEGLDYDEDDYQEYIEEAASRGLWDGQRISKLETSHLNNIVAMLERQGLDVPPRITDEIKHRQQKLVEQWKDYL